jgi:alkylhydroperoxidase/carboxymuconolactone decarboxylase family protein YurZ
MGLKDSLQQLISDVEYQKYCKFGSIYMSLDQETRELLAVALRGDAPTLQITKALNSDGIDVRREHVGEKRACFTSDNPNCCLRKNNQMIEKSE